MVNKNIRIDMDSGGMGFKDFGCFNQAFLTKEGWRIIKDPNLLVSRILKASYFKDKNFLEPKYDSAASYVWRNIVWGKYCLKVVVSG